MYFKKYNLAFLLPTTKILESGEKFIHDRASASLFLFVLGAAGDLKEEDRKKIAKEKDGVKKVFTPKIEPKYVIHPV